MGRTITAIVIFIITYAIVLGILQFIVHVSGAVLKLGIGAVIALIAAGIAFAVARGATTPSA